MPILLWGGVGYLASDLLDWLAKDDGTPPPPPAPTPVGNNVATLAVVSVVAVAGYLAYKKLS